MSTSLLSAPVIHSISENEQHQWWTLTSMVWQVTTYIPILSCLLVGRASSKCSMCFASVSMMSLPENRAGVNQKGKFGSSFSWYSACTLLREVVERKTSRREAGWCLWSKHEIYSDTVCLPKLDMQQGSLIPRSAQYATKAGMEPGNGVTAQIATIEISLLYGCMGSVFYDWHNRHEAEYRQKNWNRILSRYTNSVPTKLCYKE